MTVWTAGRVRAALDLPPGPNDGVTFAGISTDSRALAPGTLFVALAGDRFDGHDYLEAAAGAGATGVVVRQGARVPPGVVAFEVPDTLKAFGLLARA
ncbi:MAG TPA: Mur ligase domain-containing protein, partial [Gemmatimonadales bacterium]|nr:Mur ligase domain-containing protein [Gemmatimonadales bacterium]